MRTLGEVVYVSAMCALFGWALFRGVFGWSRPRRRR